LRLPSLLADVPEHAEACETRLSAALTG